MLLHGYTPANPFSHGVLAAAATEDRKTSDARITAVVIPAQAGIQKHAEDMDSRVRGNDGLTLPVRLFNGPLGVRRQKAATGGEFFEQPRAHTGA